MNNFENPQEESGEEKKAREAESQLDLELNNGKSPKDDEERQMDYSGHTYNNEMTSDREHDLEGNKPEEE